MTKTLYQLQAGTSWTTKPFDVYVPDDQTNTGSDYFHANNTLAEQRHRKYQNVALKTPVLALVGNFQEQAALAQVTIFKKLVRP